MITAIIDVGSNTIRQMVYEYSNDNYRILFDRKTMAGLVHYVKKKRMNEDGIRLVCATLNEYLLMLRQSPVTLDSIHVIATASIRNIENTQEVIEAIFEHTGLQVEVIEGEEEARLSYIGAAQSVHLEDGVLVDIGGGSTEIAVFQNKEICFSESLSIGSLNMYERFVKKIIPAEEEREAIAAWVRYQLSTLKVPDLGPLPICGVGGTIRNAYKLKAKLNEDTDEKDILTTVQLRELLQRFKNHKKKHIGAILLKAPDRIHTLIPGMIVLHEIANFFQSESVYISRNGIREGFLYDRVIKGREKS
ncbi:rod shape-determining protein [Marinicrinis lubricantis]|uniref:Rod shape-determining protein n=1 Tax=Marinicrinis lubricantis TaxID=2086470 RepID=A0ABW1IKZ4_9BACL